MVYWGVLAYSLGILNFIFGYLKLGYELIVLVLSKNLFLFFRFIELGCVL